jgi:hypothetical protein
MALQTGEADEERVEAVVSEAFFDDFVNSHIFLLLMSY